MPMSEMVKVVQAVANQVPKSAIRKNRRLFGLWLAGAVDAKGRSQDSRLLRA
jgi:hypothetical protein